MGTLPSAQALMGVSLGFHIVYAALGIGLPLFLLMAEGLSIKRGDELYHQLARRWARTAGLLFAIGAVSGTMLSFELGLLWPEFMRFAGGVIGAPFALEGFAFFTEAIFLGLYLYGERRLSRKAQFLVTIPIAVASAISAVFIISANAWMNTPAGFRVANGMPVDVNPFKAMFNPSMPYETVHGTLASYVATALALGGVYAFAMLRGQRTDYNRRALSLATTVGAIVLPLMLITGHLSARFVAHEEPAKLAAMESLFDTTKGAPMLLGGWPDPATGQTKLAVSIPKALSLLGFENPNATVTGLNAFPGDRRPNPRLVHTFFDLMVLSFFVMVIALAWYWWHRWRRAETPPGNGLLRALVAASPFGFIALQSGWMVTEFGRQPWIIHGVMVVAEGVTPRAGINLVFLVFGLVYIALTIGLLWLLVDGRLIGRPHRRPAEGGTGLVHP